MVKLNKSRIRWLVRQVIREGRKPSEVVSVYKMGVRRVQQLVKQFNDSGMMPELRKERRPKTFLNKEQKKSIDLTFGQTLLSPRLLYYKLKKRNVLVPKNKLYEYLKEKGKVVPNTKKQKKRKRCWYERKLQAKREDEVTDSNDIFTTF